MKACNDCGSELEPISPAQSEYVTGKTFRMPFTDICLTIYHDKPTIQYGCTSCLVEASHDKYREPYDAGWNDALDKVGAYND